MFVGMYPQATQARVALGRLHDLLTAKELPPTIQPAPEASAGDAVHAAGDGERGAEYHERSHLLPAAHEHIYPLP